ncbi:hypothetical protein CBR_g37483 [Chara braunii]|uniref:Reverse transcriptase domain-containing protein n=1 Tax=Chara braunii TaxID=69332 RepID=A0A388LN99_CHABU|nr:hypothetical protein CBR_g37483 [Chara braunii]|eukprot:GBG83682.1 hypothetical protein CBR_g37483 [Chara braunii]
MDTAKKEPDVLKDADGDAIVAASTVICTGGEIETGWSAEKTAGATAEAYLDRQIPWLTLPHEEVLVAASYLEGSAARWLSGYVELQSYGHDFRAWAINQKLDDFLKLLEERWHDLQEAQKATDAILTSSSRTFKYGLYEFVVMPFGLCNAPGTFQHAMNRIFHDYLDKFVIVYLDDILIFSRIVEGHVGHLDKVLSLLRQHQFKINREKCEFGRTRILYLGHEISAEGLKPDDAKVASIRDWPRPQSVTEMSELWKAAAAEQGTQLQMTFGNHPEANGQAEQLNHAALGDRFADKERARKAADRIARLGQQRYSGTLKSLFAEFEQLTSTPGLVMSADDLLTNFCRAAPEKFSAASYIAGHKDWRSFGCAALDMEAKLHVQAPSSDRRKGAFPRGGRNGKAAFAHAGFASASDSDSQADTPSTGTGPATETDVAAALTQAVLGILQQQKRFSPTTASASAKGKDKGLETACDRVRLGTAWAASFCYEDPDPDQDPGQDELQSLAAFFFHLKEQKKHKSDLILLRPLINHIRIKGLLDCGATRNFISPSAVKKLHLGMKVQQLQQPLLVRIGDSTMLTIREKVKGIPVTFDSAGEVRHSLNFYIFPDLPFDLVFSMQWLRARVELPNSQGVYQPCMIAADHHPKTSCYCLRAREFHALSCQYHHEHMFIALVKQTDAPPVSCPPEIQQVVDQYADLMKEPFGLPNRPTKHRIELLPGAVPPKGRIYRMSPAELEELRKQLETLTSKGWIRPNTSEFGAPVLFVPKGNGEFRMCIDYRGLNKITRTSTEPVPRIDNLLDMVQGCTVFSKVDLKSGYHQIEMAEEDVYKTAFKTRYGTYEFLVMPFGLCNAPGTFQTEMHRIFRHYLDKFMVVYLDDILVFSKTVREHAEHLALVLESLRDSQYKINREKSSFGVPSIIYLGHVISGDGLAPEAAKIAAIQDEEWQSYCKDYLHSRLDMTSGHHPEANGLAEVMNQVLFQLLRPVISPDQQDWDLHLSRAQLVYNMSVHSSTGFTPYRLHWGREPRQPLDDIIDKAKSYVTLGTAEFTRRYRIDVERARPNLFKAQKAMIEQANRHRRPSPIRTGDHVWVASSELSREENISPKLLPRYLGPWQVLDTVGADPFGPSYVIDVPLHLRTYPVFHASKLLPFTPADAFPDRSPQFGPPIPGKGYDMEWIEDEWGTGPDRQYLVRFAFQPPSENIWFYRRELLKTAKSVVLQYEAAQKGNLPRQRTYGNGSKMPKERRLCKEQPLKPTSLEEVEGEPGFWFVRDAKYIGWVFNDNLETPDWVWVLEGAPSQRPDIYPPSDSSWQTKNVGRKSPKIFTTDQVLNKQRVQEERRLRDLQMDLDETGELVERRWTEVVKERGSDGMQTDPAANNATSSTVIQYTRKGNSGTGQRKETIADQENTGEQDVEMTEDRRIGVKRKGEEITKEEAMGRETEEEYHHGQEEEEWEKIKEYIQVMKAQRASMFELHMAYVREEEKARGDEIPLTTNPYEALNEEEEMVEYYAQQYCRIKKDQTRKQKAREGGEEQREEGGWRVDRYKMPELPETYNKKRKAEEKKKGNPKGGKGKGSKEQGENAKGQGEEGKNGNKSQMQQEQGEQINERESLLLQSEVLEAQVQRLADLNEEMRLKTVTVGSLNECTQTEFWNKAAATSKMILPSRTILAMMFDELTEEWQIATAANFALPRLQRGQSIKEKLTFAVLEKVPTKIGLLGAILRVPATNGRENDDREDSLDVRPVVAIFSPGTSLKGSLQWRPWWQISQLPYTALGTSVLAELPAASLAITFALKVHRMGQKELGDKLMVLQEEGEETTLQISYHCIQIPFLRRL